MGYAGECVAKDDGWKDSQGRWKREWSAFLCLAFCSALDELGEFESLTVGSLNSAIEISQKRSFVSRSGFQCYSLGFGLHYDYELTVDHKNVGFTCDVSLVAMNSNVFVDILLSKHGAKQSAGGAF